MTMIVRGTGLVCGLIATWQVVGLITYLWEKRETLSSVVGYGSALTPAVLLSVTGISLWLGAGRLGRWLCKGPERRKRPAVIPAFVPEPHEDDE